ncbi:MAG: hypothetical protein OXB84_03220 [Halobacteriovoraceae bacterium]|nr:hypothetical protein [Halobacteriovoraceae bacterium]
MNREIRIDGVYDEKTILGLKDIPVRNINFDFRPKSFNFLQHYRFMQILEKIYNTTQRYFLHFNNESNNMIFKFLNDLDKRYQMSDNFILEFSDHQRLDFYQQFDHPFFWHYRPEKIFDELLEIPQFKGLVLPHSFLTGLHEQGKLNNFTRNFHQLFYGKKKTSIELALSLEWNADIFPSLFDLFEFDMICFTINNQVEHGYRQINVDLLRKHCNLVK